MRYGSVLEFEGRLPDLADDVVLMHGSVVLGDVTIGAGSSVWFNAVVRGDVNYIRIGKRTNIQDGCVLHVARRSLPLIVGDEVTVGHNVTLHACTVGNRCLIGMGAIVMDGAVIGDEVIVAAGALVPAGKTLPPRTLWIGSPARQARALTQGEIANLAESAAHYVALKDDYLRAAPARP